MLIKNSEIINCTDVLNKLSETRFPSATVSFIVLRNTKKLVEEQKLIEETRQKLLKEYCKMNEEGNLIIENGYVLPEDADGLSRAVTELFEAEVEIDLASISIESLETANLAPCELDKILFMIEGEKNG